MRSTKLLAFAAGCLCSWNSTYAQTVSYTYDALGRLTQVQTPAVTGDDLRGDNRLEPGMPASASGFRCTLLSTV